MQEQLPLFAFSPKRGKGGSDYNTSYLEVAAALRHNDTNDARKKIKTKQTKPLITSLLQVIYIKNKNKQKKKKS